MPFAVETHVDQGRHILGGDPSSPQNGDPGGLSPNNSDSLKVANHLVMNKIELQCLTVCIWRGYFYGGRGKGTCNSINNSDSLKIANHIIMYKIEL